MDAARVGTGGGILGLCRLIREHEDAARFDLLKVGRSLDDLFAGRLGWPDLRAVVRNAEAGSLLRIAVFGDEGRYSRTDYLLVALLNTLRSMSWQIGGDEKAPKPKPIRLPGMEDENTQAFGSDPIPIAEFNDWWDSA